MQFSIEDQKLFFMHKLWSIKKFMHIKIANIFFASNLMTIGDCLVIGSLKFHTSNHEVHLNFTKLITLTKVIKF